MKIKIKFCDWLCKRQPRLIPMLGPIVEQSGPVAKTPQFKAHWKGMTLMAFSMSDSQQVGLTIKVVDKKGNKAPIDGVPEWSVDNTELLALTPAADGLTCVVAAVGPLGDGNVTVKCDADLGSGVVPIIGTLAVTITGGAATTVTIDAGTPTEQP